MSGNKIAIIVGAGPAGLTAAYELLNKSDIKPIILEKTDDIGGISKTVVYKGNRIDIGGHRFFSKSDIVMNWWKNIMPIQGAASLDDIIREQKLHQKQNPDKLSKDGPDPEKTDLVMLIRSRLSRIFFLRKFFDYPVTLNVQTLQNLGLIRIIKIGFSYLRIKIFPTKDIQTLEDFFISRFGLELYKTFFKDYTEKVWGAQCKEINADWGAQRIKELSASKALLHAIKSIIKKDTSIEQKDTDTSLIEQFMYPKYGPGQLWETVASIIESKGGQIIKHADVVGINVEENNTVSGLSYIDTTTGNKVTIHGDYFLSTMPVKDLIRAMGDSVPADVAAVSDGLMYRDFITVGVLLHKLKIKNEAEIATINDIVPDNWIYIQEREVKVGRLQIFNNWSPYMVADINKAWIGMEYFCNEGDSLWKMNDKDFMQFAIDELAKIDIIEKEDVVDSTIIRMPKTYPAYFGTYKNFDVVRNYTDTMQNLFLIGRNGMHKYNNQDHSMLTAITAVNNIISGSSVKSNIWGINTEEEYHEKK
jgi:protoporphyrinogen oxidase